MKAWGCLLSGDQRKYQEGLKLRFQGTKKEALWIFEVVVRSQFKGQKMEQALNG